MSYPVNLKDVTPLYSISCQCNNVKKKKGLDGEVSIFQTMGVKGDQKVQNNGFL